MQLCRPGGRRRQPVHRRTRVQRLRDYGVPPGPKCACGVRVQETQWEGFGRTQDSWEPASAFVPRYTNCFINFLKCRKVDLKVMDVYVLKKA